MKRLTACRKLRFLVKFWRCSACSYREMSIHLSAFTLHCLVISCSLVPKQLNPSATSFPKVVGRYDNTKSDDAYTHHRTIDPVHQTTTQVSAKQCTGRHDRDRCP